MTHPMFSRPKQPVHADELARMHGDVTDILHERTPGWRFGGDRPFVMAIDPGGTMGWSWIDPQGGTEFGTFPAKDALGAKAHDGLEGLFARFDHNIQLAKQHGWPWLVVVEDAFLHNSYFEAKTAKKNGKPGPVARSSPDTLRVLGYRIGAVATMASLRRLPVWRVMAQEWQLPMIGRCLRDEGKKRSEFVAERITKKRVTSDHESDAILIGIWAHGPPMSPRSWGNGVAR